MATKTRPGGLLRELSLSILVVAVAGASWAADRPQKGAEKKQAARILQTTGVRGGLVVHLGSGDGKLTAALGAGESYVVQGLDADPKSVESARSYVRDLGICGRVSFERLVGETLPYADDLVNLVVAEEAAGVSSEEVLRVLAPGGVAYLWQGGQWAKTVKPWPEEIDDWTHYLHDASGNAVAADQRVGPPKQVRWIAGPYWARSHEFNPSINAAVSGGGRLFYTLDEGVAGIHDSPKFRLPARWSLIGRDALSGVLLWKRHIPNWGFREWNTVGMWSAPLTLQRRLVTDGQRVFFTLGYKAPVSVLDAVSGKTLQTVPNTAGTDELVLCDGVLLACVRQRLSVAALPDGNPKKKPRRRLNPHEWTVSSPGPASIKAIDAATGRILWENAPEAVKILTLAAADGRAFYHDAKAIVCVDMKTGRRQWATDCRPSGGSRHSAGTLVVHDDVVLYTGGKGVIALSAETGEQLWGGVRVSGPGVAHPPDLFVADGLVWTGDAPGEHRRDRTTVKREGRDMRTGEVKKTIEVANLISPMHHFRCYRSKATDRFLLLTKRGVEFLDLEGQDHMREDWLRAGCSYGFIPCNGLLYVTPHHCFCYPGVRMNGFLALAAGGEAESGKRRAEGVSRLERGPAYGRAPSPESPTPSPSDWPTYRHDGARSGRYGDALPSDLAESWQVEIGGRLVQPVVAGGKVFVAQVDAHTVHALDAADGKRLWSYTAGARVDSPPTVCGGLVLFGSRDGWVYCLRAADGALAWRFLAAPERRRIMAFNQLESPWPVPGSVLVQNGVAYVCAGRSSFLDGGVHLYGLEPATGKVVCQTNVEGPWPDPQKDVGRPFDMEGTKGDLLVGDGKYLYLFQMVFDERLRVQKAPRTSTLGDRKVGLHLMSTGGFVDHEWYDRTYWTYSRRWPGFYYANSAPKAGQILVFDDETVYGLHVFTKRLRLSPTFEPAAAGYKLFADDVANEPVLAPNSIDREKGPGFSRAAEPKWSRQVPLRVRGLVLAGDKLVMAGEPDVIPEDDPYAAFEGRRGGKLWVVAAANGEKLAEQEINSPPVFDGLSAAGGGLFIATADGRILCFRSRQ